MSEIARLKIFLNPSTLKIIEILSVYIPRAWSRGLRLPKIKAQALGPVKPWWRLWRLGLGSAGLGPWARACTTLFETSSGAMTMLSALSQPNPDIARKSLTATYSFLSCSRVQGNVTTVQRKESQRWRPEVQQLCQLSANLGPQTSNSVAEVLFRTAPENQNRQNRTVKFSSVLFSPRNSWSCSVLGSYIWEDIQNRVRTGSNRTSSDIILCFQTEAAVCLSECHLFFLFLFGQHGNHRTTLKPW